MSDSFQQKKVSPLADLSTPFIPAPPASGPAAAQSQPAQQDTYKTIDVSSEAWREYTWTNPHDNVTQHRKRIKHPLKVVYRKGGETHRVVAMEDGREVGIIVPAPGHMGCTIQFQAKDGSPTIVA